MLLSQSSKYIAHIFIFYFSLRWNVMLHLTEIDRLYFKSYLGTPLCFSGTSSLSLKETVVRYYLSHYLIDHRYGSNFVTYMSANKISSVRDIPIEDVFFFEYSSVLFVLAITKSSSPSYIFTHCGILPLTIHLIASNNSNFTLKFRMSVIELFLTFDEYIDRLDLYCYSQNKKYHTNTSEFKKHV